MLKEVVSQVKRFFSVMSNNRIETYAACTTFFLYVGVAPWFLVLLTLIPYLPISEQNLNEFFTYLLPSGMSNLALSLTAELSVRSPGILSVSTIVALWVASKATVSLSRGMDAIFGKPEKRNVILYYAECIACTLFICLFLLILLVGMIFGEEIINYVTVFVPNIAPLIEYLYTSKLVLFPVLFIVIYMLYFILPGRSLHFATRFPGALLTTVVIGLIISVYTWYYSTMTGKSVYGSMAGVVLLLLLFYYAVYLFFIGAQLNQMTQNWIEEKERAHVEKVRQKGKTKAEKTRPAKLSLKGKLYNVEPTKTKKTSKSIKK